MASASEPAVVIVTPSESLLSPTPSRTPSPNLNPLVRLSAAESRTDTTSGGILLLQRPPMTAAEIQIQNHRNVLNKFMCVMVTLPVIATLAIYNKIELVMWWVIVLPIVGIAVAVVWRWKLGQRLQRLHDEAVTSRLSLRGASIRSPPSHSHQDNDSETATPLPPPDYQASIITPPAYILAQQPRKVPSYRSLENLFALARQGASSIMSRGGGGGDSRLNSREHLPQPTTGEASGSQYVAIVIEQPPEQSVAEQISQDLNPTASEIDMEHAATGSSGSLSTTAVSSDRPPAEASLTTRPKDTMPEMVEIRAAAFDKHSLHIFAREEDASSDASPSAGTSVNSPSAKDVVGIDQESLHSGTDENTGDDAEHSKQTLRELKGKAPSR
ncbi:hypothetical protein BGX26_011785 [Mortierella sp. AD094]|nr:hypothetical protein BGX26_011785 [Mortierella sp. AD094]